MPSRPPASPSKTPPTARTGLSPVRPTASKQEGEIMAGKPGRPGASKSSKKGPTKGTGGKNKRSLEGRGPTPKAEDRAWHPAGKRKAAAERYAAAGGKGSPTGSAAGRGGNRAPRGKKDDDTEVV